MALVGAFQIGYLEMFVEAGYLFAHADLSVAGTDGSTKLNAKVTASTPAPLVGAGCRYEFSERWHLKVEFDRYDGVGDAMSTGDANFTVVTVGLGICSESVREGVVRRRAEPRGVPHAFSDAVFDG